MIAPDYEGAAYRRLAAVLRARIRTGELPAGRRMPSEKDLHDEFGLARETVRRALALLRQEGLAEVRRGRGTFVAEVPPTVALADGDTVTSTAAMTVTHASGEIETFPVGTTLTIDGVPPTNSDRPIVAAAVIVHMGQVLLVRRRVAEGELSWQFPAGQVEPGESNEDAAVRETKEETDLTVRAAAYLGTRVHPNTGRTMVYIACDLVDGTARVADEEELAEVAWCDRAALTQYVPYPIYGPVRAYLDAALR